MKKGSKKNRKGFDELADDEHIVSSIASLLKHLTPIGGELYDRLINKFKENSFEKLERLLELHDKYTHKVEAYDFKIEEEKRTRRDAGDELTEMDEEYYLQLRLDEGHLFSLQLTDYVISTVAVSGLEEANTYIKKLLAQQGGSLAKLKQVLQGYASSIGSSESSDEDMQRERKAILELAEKLC